MTNSLDKDILSHSPHLSRVGIILRRKKISLFKRSLRQGKKDSERSSEDFLKNLRLICENAQAQKIMCITNHASTLIKRQLDLTPSLIIGMTIKVLKSIAEHTDVELTLNPHDAIIIKNSLKEISLACSSDRKIAVVEDENFSRGSLVIKANISIIDAHVDTQLNKALELLKKAVEVKHGLSH